MSLATGHAANSGPKTLFNSEVTNLFVNLRSKIKNLGAEGWLATSDNNFK